VITEADEKDTVFRTQNVFQEDFEIVLVLF